MLLVSRTGVFGDADIRAVHEVLENRALSQRGKSSAVGPKVQFRKVSDQLPAPAEAYSHPVFHLGEQR